MKKCPHCNGSLMLLRKESTVENAVFRTDSHFICKTCRRDSVDTQVWIRVCGVPLNREDAHRPATAGEM